jgi:serine/threonine protein kinase
MDDELETAIAPIVVPLRLGEYQFLDTIGSGAFSVVKQGFSSTANRPVAIKIVPKARLNTPDIMRSFQNELSITCELHHPNIVECYGHQEDRLNYYVIMEFCPGGDLFPVLLQRSRLSESEARPLIHEILSAVEHLHSRGICHRDIKLENGLLDSSGHAKLSDFGFARFFSADELLHTRCGSLCYTAPEVATSQPYSGPQADMWSCGVMFFVMLTGAIPWVSGANPVALIQEIQRVKPRFPAYLSPLIQDLIRGMMMIEPSQRISAAEALTHPWVTQNTEHLKGNVSQALSFQNVHSILGDGGPSRLPPLIPGGEKQAVRGGFSHGPHLRVGNRRRALLVP